MTDDLYPSREAHLGQQTNSDADTTTNQIDDILYFVNRYNEFGDTANLRQAAQLINALLVENEDSDETVFITWGS